MSGLDSVGRFRRRNGAPPLIFGHRGVRGEAPENTMASFELAAAGGAAGVELDVRLCKSGEVVVCHDPTLERVTEGRDTGDVADRTLAELQRVDLGNGQRVPVLDQVLAWSRPRKMLVNVELKRDVPDRVRLVRETARVLRTQGSALASIVVSSFDPWMLAYFGWLLPGVARGWLFGSEQRLAARTSGVVAVLIGADAVHPEKALVDPERCRAWKKRGKLINVWTVNDPGEARALAAMGIDAMFTDVPRALVAALT